MYRRSVPLLPLIISVFHFNCSITTKVYSGIQTFRRSVPLLPLIISVFHFNCSATTKVYSGIQTFRRSVPLLPLIISIFHFNCSVITKAYSEHPDVSSECATVAFNNFCFSLWLLKLVITKVYSGIQMYRRSVPMLPLIISVPHVNCSATVFHFNCSVITKAFRGIHGTGYWTWRKSEKWIGRINK